MQWHPQPFSKLFDDSPSVFVTRNSKTNQFFIENGKIALISCSSKDRLCAILRENAVPSVPESVQVFADIDDSAVWEGMLSELSMKNGPIPNELSSISDEVESLRKERKRIDKAAKSKKTNANSGLSGKDREAKKELERLRRKAEKATQQAITKASRPSLSDEIVSNRLSKKPGSKKTLDFLDGVEGADYPSLEDVRVFVAESEDFLSEICLSGGYRKSMPVMERIALLRAEIIIRFPEYDDPMRPILGESLEKRSKPERRAENTV